MTRHELPVSQSPPSRAVVYLEMSSAEICRDACREEASAEVSRC